MDIICGINSVLEAFAAGSRHFDRLLVVKGTRNPRVDEVLGRAGHHGIPLRFESRETLDRMAGGVPHQGVIAVVSAKPVFAVETLLETLRDPALLVVLDGVEDPRNLGAILRTSEAAGVDGVLLPERHSAGLSETVARASAGALEHVRVARVGNVVQALETLKQRGLWIVGFDAGGSERWDAVDLRRPLALVLGGEGRGIRRLVREHCDHLVSLPLFGHVASLNVSVVAGIALYEAVRQRGVIPSQVKPIPLRAATAADGPAAAAAGGDASVEIEDQEPVRVLRFDEQDDAGPVVLKPAHGFGRRGGPRSQRGGRGHEGGRRQPAAPTSAAPEGGPADAASGHRRRRRRRRRGNGPGAPMPQAGPIDPNPPEGTAPGAPGPGDNPGQRRRRRRRRRRP